MSDPPSGFQGPVPAGESLDSAILRLLMETIPDRIYFKDLESRFVRVNKASAKWLGVSSPAEAIGKSDFDFYSEDHAKRAFAGEQEIIRTGVAAVGKVEPITKADGTTAWGYTSKMPWRDAGGVIIGTFGLTRDFTAIKRAEEKLEEDHRLLRTIIDNLPGRVYVKDAAGRYVINNVSHLQWLGGASEEGVRGKTTLDFFPGERGEQAVADDQKILKGQAASVDEERSNFGPEGTTRWSLTRKVPLHDAKGEIVGLVGVSLDITRRKLAEQELQHRSAEMEADVRMARQIQEAFFPRVYPVFPRGVPADASALHFSHRYLPATTLGGDFFDIVQLSDTRCGVLVSDVMGHGVRAGLLTALISGILEELGHTAEDPAHVLGEINHGLARIIEQTGQPVFATVFYGVIDSEARTLVYGNAGHPSPFILRPAARAAEQIAAGDPELAAGLVEGFPYTRRETAFGPGDILFCYTDGLIEAVDHSGTMFGVERLRESLQGSGDLPGSQLVDRLVKEVEAYTGRTEFDDDICLLLVESKR